MIPMFVRLKIYSVLFNENLIIVPRAVSPINLHQVLSANFSIPLGVNGDMNQLRDLVSLCS